MYLMCLNEGCSSTRDTLVHLTGSVEARTQHWFSEVCCRTLLGEPGINEYSINSLLSNQIIH